MLNITSIDQILYLLLLLSHRALFWGHYYSGNFSKAMVSDVFNMLMYADDTTLYYNIDQNVSKEVINNELSKVSQWLAANKLLINMTKTKYMFFHLHKKVVTYPDLQLNGNKIERVTQFNFLGLILQSNLSWNKHVNHMSLKVSKTIGILYRLKSVYPLKVLRFTTL